MYFLKFQCTPCKFFPPFGKHSHLKRFLFLYWRNSLLWGRIDIGFQRKYNKLSKRLNCIICKVVLLTMDKLSLFFFFFFFLSWNARKTFFSPFSVPQNSYYFLMVSYILKYSVITTINSSSLQVCTLKYSLGRFIRFLSWYFSVFIPCVALTVLFPFQSNAKFMWWLQSLFCSILFFWYCVLVWFTFA